MNDKTCDYYLSPLTFEHKDLLLNWRNSDHIRQNMHNSKIISTQEHNSWFEKVISATEKNHFVFYYENKPVGYVSFSQIDNSHKHAYWGFYLGDLNTPKGVSYLMGSLAIDYFFNERNFHKLYAEVLYFNNKSLRYHDQLGFNKETILKEHVLREDKFIDVQLYSYLKAQWFEKNKIILKQIYQIFPHLLKKGI